MAGAVAGAAAQMQDFGIMSPIKPALEAILTDYPGGQLLSEALQNAEDSGAETFLLRLDLRPQDGIGDSNLRGAAFVLIDDGAGFSDREWTSLQNLHDSKKANSPREIGQFGMGSRSYFHYADCITVCSNGMYVGLDPLQIITADKRKESPLPGWMYALNCEDSGKIPALKREAEQLFGDCSGKGAVFRLPLRRADQVADGLGPEVSANRKGSGEDEWLNPEDLLKRWAESLLDGRLMLFLASVRVVRLERWDIGAAAPTLVAEVTKTFPDGDVPFTRLPVPDAACTTFEDLSKHLAGKSPAEMQTLAERHEARVQTRAKRADGQTSEASWLVVQRFDINHKLIDLMPKALAVPVIGVAVQLDGGHVTDPVRSAQEGREMRVQKLEPDTPAPQLEAIRGCGEVFCFLPVSDLPGTGLPVHVNASFKLEKNRRAMFLEKKDYDHKHKVWATWNRILMSEAVPMLWLDMLKSISENSEHGGRLVTFLPNLDVTQADWKTCATELYKLMRSSEILPHDRANDPTAPKWVQPAGARAVAPTSASLEAQAELMVELYSECASFELTIVSLPAHVEAACVEHSGLAKHAHNQLEAARFVHALFNEHRQRVLMFEGHQFAPIILALAEYGVMKTARNLIGGGWELWQDTWKQLLSRLAWMPISGSNPQTYSMAAKTFVPNQPHFEDMNFSVVEAAVADLTCPGASNLAAICDAAAHLGSKKHMNWDDVVAEAKHVAASSDRQSAFRLLYYIEQHHWSIGTAPLSRADAIVVLKQVAFVPGEDACLHAPLSADVPPGAQQQELYRPSDLLPSGGRTLVWAAHATDAKDEHWTRGCSFLTELQTQPTAHHYVLQIQALAQHGYSVHVEHHLLEAFKALLNALRMFHCKQGPQEQILSMKPLSNTAWVPASLDGGRRELLKAGRVAMTWEHQVCPAFGKLPETWCDELKRYVQHGIDQYGVLKATGINIKVPAELLARELETMAGNPFGEQLSLVVNLCRELVCRCESDSTVAESYMNHEKVCHVPTTSGTLEPAKEVFINDAPWHSEGASSAKLLHEKLDTEAGRVLGCRSVRSELARRCEMDFSEEFGQQEDLRDRIRSLLNEYNDPFDIFTEHWQNSDDAEADSVKFVLDTGVYPIDSLVDRRPGCKALQGPALLLASSQPLDGDDVRRIQRLGRSDKQKQFDSTGRFGVGLVCLYHVTDTPTFLANDALHVMDPCHTAVSDESSNGKKWKRDMLSESFPHMLEPFESVDQQDFPTIFRLPLRTGYNLHLGKDCSTAESVATLLQKFADQAQELLVFSKHVRTATFTIKDAKGERSITARCEPNAGHAFLQKLPKTLEEVQALHQSPRENISQMDITVTGTAPNGREMTSAWIVSHRLEADANIQQLVQQKFSEGTAVLPHGAAALRVGAPQDYAGRLCCFLPLAGLYCGPPVLIHGPFALSQSRKQIQLPTAFSAENSDQQWNQALLRGPIASSLACLVSELKETVEGGDMTLSKWFEVIELADDFQNGGTAQHRKVLREALLEKLLRQHDTFPVIHVDDNSETLLESLQWHSHMGSGLLLRTPDLGASAQNVLIDTGLRLVHLTASLVQHFVATAAGQDKIPHCLTAGELCAHMCGLDEEQLGTLEPEVRLELLSFVVPPADTRKTPLEFPQLLRGVELLQDADEGWQKFGEGLECFWDHAGLLPNKPELFIHADVRSILSKASTSLDDVKSAAQELGIVEMTPERLVQYQAHVHEECLHKDKSWRETFYQFAWNKFADEPQRFCDMFGDWSVLKVFCRTRVGPEGKVAWRCVPLRDHNSVFSMHEIDTAWQEDVGKVLLTCGLNILHGDHVSDTNQMELLDPLVGKDDDHLLDTLNDAIAELWNRSLDTKTTAQLLKYLQSRRDLTKAQLHKIRALPLFVTQDRDDPWTDLADTSVTYVCFSSEESTKQKYADELRRLTLPGRPVKFLAYPPKGCDDMYKRLGIQLLSTYDFIVGFVCPVLPAAAEQGAPVLDSLLSVLMRRISKENDWKMVKEAAAKQKFVQSKAGGTMVKPSKLLDPNLLLAIEFVDEIEEWLPAEHLHEHNGLLLKLGLRTDVPSSCLRRCAVVMDATAEKLKGTPVDEATQRRSFCLIDAICRQLQPLFARMPMKTGGGWCMDNGETKEEAILAKKESELVEMLRTYRVAVADGPTEQRQHLQRFRKLLLTPGCVTCAGSCVKRFVVDAGRPAEKASFTRAGRSALQSLIEFHPDAILTKLECYCTPMQLDISTLLMQLRHLVQGKQKIFAKGELVVRKLNLVLRTLDKRLADDSEDLVADEVLLEELRGLPCLPVETTEDAAGETRIQLVSPDRAFQRLQDAAASEPSIPFIETSLHVTHPHAAKALGIGEMPTALDWARCTRIIAEGTNGKEAAPDEIGAMFFAVRAFLKSDDLSDAPFEIWLADKESKICSFVRAGQLLYKDRLQFSHRCETLTAQLGLQFVRERRGNDHNHSLTRKQLDALCELTELRRVSDVVSVALSENTKGSPTEDDVCFEQFLRSPELAEGFCACLRHGRHMSDDLDDPEKFDTVRNVVQESLTSLSVCWAKSLDTHLRSTIEDTDKGLEDSTASEFAFFNAETLWIRADILGGTSEDKDKEDQLLEVLSDSVINAIVRAAGAPTIFNTSRIQDLLKHWKRGPSSIARMLKSKDIKMSSSEDDSQGRPGALVPETLIKLLQQTTLCTFEEKATVAIDCGRGKKGITEYRFAVVRPSKDLRSKANNSLLREYRLLCPGLEEQPEIIRPRLEIFMFSRDSLTPDKDELALQSSDAPMDPEASPDAASDWEALVEELRKMESLPEQHYKKMLHRLFRQWHPDKCPAEKAEYGARFFDVMRRHEKSFKAEEQDFSWLYGATNADEALGAESSQVPSADDEDSDAAPEPGPEPHSWMVEFEREQRSSEQQRKYAAIAETKWQESVASPRNERRQYPELSDYYWQGARNQQRFATLAFENDQWTFAVWNFQQAVELSVKALMMRTCGITDFEHKGKGAHDLIKMMGRICQGEWPVAKGSLGELSKAYLGARYPTSGPTDRRYVEGDAKTAMETARQVIDWVIAQDTLPTPEAEAEDEEADEPKPKPKHVVLDPAPPPPGPAIPSSEPALPPPPPTPAVEAPAPAPVLASQPVPLALRATARPAVQDSKDALQIGDVDLGFVDEEPQVAGASAPGVPGVESFDDGGDGE